MADGLNNNQENQSGHGGARPGAGRPKGSSNKPKISDHLTDEEVKEARDLLAQAGSRSKSTEEVTKIRALLESASAL